VPLRSPIPLGFARELLDYDRALFERYERKVRALPKKGAFQNCEIGHLSPFATLVHVLNVHQVWLDYIVAGRQKELARLFSDPKRHPTTWRGFDAYRDAVWKAEAAFARRLTEEALSRQVRAPWMPGRYTLGDAILQTSFEEAHHLGEIIGVLHQQDRRPPDMTWIQLRRQARPR
jgi:uncharacterized damage-inducible protein DinB